MNQPAPTGPGTETGFTGPELFASSMQHVDDAIHEVDDASPLSRMDYLRIAQIHAVNAQTAILVSLVETRGDYPPYEIDAWREVVPLPPLKVCKHKEARRPQCTPVHTEDCAFADPVPEPKHVLLPVGTRVLVSETVRYAEDYPRQPYVAKVVGYDMHHSKYQLHPEDSWNAGEYIDIVRWAFADNRVQPHPDEIERSMGLR